jgi:hypothetical protein
MNKACFLTAGLVAAIFAAGNATAAPAGWTTAKADDGRKLPARGHAAWSRAYVRAGDARYSGGHGYTAYGAAWDYLGWSHLIGHPYYGYGYPYDECPVSAVGVAGDSLGAVTPGALGTSRYGWW